QDLAYANSLLHDALGEGPIYEGNDSLVVYEVRDVPEDSRTPKSLRYLGRGWHNLEMWESVPTRWMGDNASIILASQENRTALLSCEVTSIRNTRTLGVSANGSPYNLSKILPGNFTSVNDLLDLRNGTNIIRLQSIEGCERPSDDPGLNSPDRRCLSMAFQNISIE
ncbi:MAG TPA: hypothetical protein VN455_11750, partial [Methanotrichaceae archaeon]|nr:hypothetical protein [Methanotrichaceae archaeon]